MHKFYSVKILKKLMYLCLIFFNSFLYIMSLKRLRSNLGKNMWTNISLLFSHLTKTCSSKTSKHLSEISTSTKSNERC